MAQGRTQFVGAAGQYYVAYGLAVREVNVSIALGNVPSVDLFASSPDGRHSMTMQVKTSRNAYRHRRYGGEGYEWDVGRAVIGKYGESFWYAFADLQEENNGWSPQVFFVPSRGVAEFVKPDWSRFMYFLPVTAYDLTHERWDLVKGYVASEQSAITWANDWPQHLLPKWGTDSPL